MTQRKAGKFLADLDSRKERKEIEKGSIWLKSYDEYKKMSEAYDGRIVKPIIAAKMLGVSRTMIFQLENQGKIRAYRLAFTDEIWRDIPVFLKPLITRSDTYIWIPLADLEKYAEARGRKLKNVKGHYINEFFG